MRTGGGYSSAVPPAPPAVSGNPYMPYIELHHVRVQSGTQVCNPNGRFMWKVSMDVGLFDGTSSIHSISNSFLWTDPTTALPR